MSRIDKQYKQLPSEEFESLAKNFKLYGISLISQIGICLLCGFFSLIRFIQISLSGDWFFGTNFIEITFWIFGILFLLSVIFRIFIRILLITELKTLNNIINDTFLTQYIKYSTWALISILFTPLFGLGFLANYILLIYAEKQLCLWFNTNVKHYNSINMYNALKMVETIHFGQKAKIGLFFGWLPYAFGYFKLGNALDQEYYDTQFVWMAQNYKMDIIVNQSRYIPTS